MSRDGMNLGGKGWAELHVTNSDPVQTPETLAEATINRNIWIEHQ